MSRRSCMTPAILLTLGGLMAVGPIALSGHALAQTAPAAGAPQAGTPQAGAGQASAPDEANAESADRYPVFAITSVEILRSQLKPQIDVIAVRGLASAQGWTEGELVPLGTGTPPDGILDLVFVAQAPQESAAPTGYEPIHAILPLSMDHPFTGIRVRSATNSVLLKSLQGYTEAKAPIEPCKECVGRYLVAKGGAAPAGTAADQILREDDLPPNTRVIRATDGITDVRHNPDRLTVLVGEDGRIVDAVWE
jgi:hypothetical protein